MVYLKSTIDKEERKLLSSKIELLHSCYQHAKMVIFEVENGLTHYQSEYIRNCRKIIYRIEEACRNLPFKEKIIIENEVLDNKKGSKWFMDFFSPTTYYNYKNKAYCLFLEMTNK